MELNSQETDDLLRQTEIGDGGAICGLFERHRPGFDGWWPRG